MRTILIAFLLPSGTVVVWVLPEAVPPCAWLA
jgi:hypothetical protein